MFKSSIFSQPKWGHKRPLGGYGPLCLLHSDGTGWIHSFCFQVLNSNSNSLTSKKLNSNSNSLTLKNLNSNSNSLILQKSNSNSNSSIIRERIQIQNSKFKFNPTLATTLLSERQFKPYFHKWFLLFYVSVLDILMFSKNVDPSSTWTFSGCRKRSLPRSWKGACNCVYFSVACNFLHVISQLRKKISGANICTKILESFCAGFEILQKPPREPQGYQRYRTSGRGTIANQWKNEKGKKFFSFIFPFFFPYSFEILCENAQISAGMQFQILTPLYLIHLCNLFVQQFRDYRVLLRIVQQLRKFSATFKLKKLAFLLLLFYDATKKCLRYFGRQSMRN